MNAQQLILGHLLPIAAAIAVLWLAYRLLFSNSNRLKFNRFFLMAAMLFSLALPLLGLLLGQESPQMVALKQSMFGGGTMLNEVIVTPGGQPVLPEVTVTTDTQSRFSVWQVIGGIYLIGVGVMTLLFLFKIAKLVVLIVRSPKERREGYTAVYLSAVPEPAVAERSRSIEGPQRGSFSFLRYAFFPDESVAPDIVRHERSHIEHHHSADILFVELMMILQWFNPFIYLYKKELQSIHEYQADRDVVATGVDKRNYMMLILQQCTAVDFSGMSNNFSLILTKKRIKMITRNEKAKGLWWRLLATLPVLALLMIANTKVAAQEKKTQDVFTIQFGDFELFNDDGTQMQLKDTVVYYEDGTYTKFESSEAVDPFTGELRKTFTVKNYTAEGTPNPNIDFTIREVERHGDTMMYSMDPFTISGDIVTKLKNKIMTDEDIDVEVTEVGCVDNDTVYNVVDQMPEFPGGMEAMMKFVADNVKYPEEAKDKNIEGRVFVGFVVEKDGSVINAKVLRGIGGGCDEEALRVVKAMPKWKPGIKDGKPVRVSYQMPFMFKLDDEPLPSPVKKADVGKPDMKPNANGIYQIVEEMPSFPGGDQKLMEYIAKNLTYPQEARDKGIDGRVFIGMVIEKDGSVSNVKVLRGIGGGCDEEAVRVISSMPKWKPGMMKGDPVPVSYQIPINFKLAEKQPQKK